MFVPDELSTQLLIPLTCLKAKDEKGVEVEASESLNLIMLRQHSKETILVARRGCEVA